jgi:protein gp37
VFALSLGDFFDNQADPEWRHDSWQVIRDCAKLDWLILTKRPQNIRKMLPPDWGDGYPHVWLGATTENQTEADRRIEHLLKVPAKIHWVSAEPLIECTDLRHSLAPPGRHGINWVVAGGETGGHERFSDPDWFRDLRDQCRRTGATFFMKQMTKKAPIPRDLRVREYPI